MTDIVERLRALGDGLLAVSVCTSAEDRIFDGEDSETAYDAAAEIERLRVALEKIANDTGCVEACPCWAKQRRKAERAILGLRP